MNNLSLNYTRQGEGDPLLIIHGLFGSSRNWRSLGKQFAQHYHVIMLDLRNHGDSPFDPAIDYELMVKDVIGLMDRLDIQSAHVLGHSMGGKVAMKLCHLYPGRVKKMIIADIAPVAYQHDYDEVIDPVLELNLAEIKNRKDADEQLKKAMPDQRIRLFILQNLSFHEGKPGWNLNWIAVKKNMSLITGFEAIKDWQISNPCLFIRGSLSDYVTQQSRDLIQQHFTEAQFITIEGAGHWLHAEQPVAFHDAVLNFIQA
ncbi:MAG: alpha/beta fold hydrolase [Gammaproteobacteria bacterium]|nr:alpha/beta fold hydrolase [Gammaproteobacteria bacterium]